MRHQDENGLLIESAKSNSDALVPKQSVPAAIHSAGDLSVSYASVLGSRHETRRDENRRKQTLSQFFVALAETPCWGFVRTWRCASPIKQVIANLLTVDSDSGWENAVAVAARGKKDPAALHG